MKNRMTKLMCIYASVCIAVSALAVIIVTGKYLSDRQSYAEAVTWVLISAALAFVVAFSAAAALADRISGAIERGDSGYSEINPLVRRLEKQSSQIKSSAGALAEKERDLAMIIEHMAEGLIMLDAQGLVISINVAACDMLGIPRSGSIGKHLFAFNQHPMLQGAVHDALGGKYANELLDMGDRAVQIMADPVEVNGVTHGAAVFVLDVTEKAAAEQMRREFSANVSHELKTPLTTISGYAELLKDGMVKPDDVERFAGDIYAEAQRLVALIDDIIKLSRLDEQSEKEIPMCSVELMPLARRVAERLSDRAASCGVALTAEGSEEAVYGNPRLLEEMIYNLCDNAVKYNHDGGYARILIGSRDNAVYVSVSDDGLGIPAEHQEHIFERFYRVDKSHSRETGGTGLGLSIVKHGAMFHSADIKLSSEPGKGTEITLIFNRKGAKKQ